ncbi:MAG: hypothetical protein KDI16_00005 [Halioglobus sp.]|nr:hypothetical protein [Halioglobus sp.]
MRNVLVSSAVLISSQLLPVTPALAQPGVLEEVIVTSRRYEESLQDTPIAVSAFTERELEERNIVTVDDIAGFSPNVSVASGYSGGSDGFYYRAFP